MVGAQFNAKEYEAAIYGTSKAAQTASVTLKAFTGALASIAITIAITELIKVINSCITASDRLQQKASALGTQYKDSASDIDSYKKQIQELRDKINDSSTSIEDSRKARQDLLGIQDQLISKYGNEKSAIYDITEAINGEVDALNRVKDAQWNQTLADLEQSEHWYDAIGDWFNRMNHPVKNTNGTGTAGSNYEALMSDMDDVSKVFSIQYNDADLLNSLGQTYKSITVLSDGFLEIDGNIYNAYSDLQSLYSAMKNSGASEASLRSLAKEMNNLNKQINDNNYIYNETVLRERILGKDKVSDNIESQYREYTNYLEQYNKAFIDNNTDLAESMLGKLAEVQGDIYGQLIENGLTEQEESVLTFIDNLAPEVAEKIKNYKFDNDFGDISSISNQLKDLEKGGSVNLLLRPEISTKELNEKGYEAGEGFATVFTSTFSNEAGDIAVNFTPIMVDPKTGKEIGVMDSNDFEKYCQEVIDGVHSDYLNLQIGAEFTGSDAIQQAEDAAIKIHELHEQLHDSSNEFMQFTEGFKSVTQNSVEAAEKEINILDAIKSFGDKDNLLNSDRSKWSEEQLRSYAAIDSYARQYGLTIDLLIDKLRELGVLSNFGRAANGTLVDAYSRVNNKGYGVKRQRDRKSYLSQALNNLSDSDYLLAETFQEGEWNQVETELKNIMTQQGLLTESTELYDLALKHVLEDMKKQAAVLDENASKAEKTYLSHIDAISSLQSATSSLSGLYNENQQINTGKIDANTVNSIEQSFMNLSEKDDSVDANTVKGFIQEFENTLVKIPGEAKDAAEAAKMTQDAVDELVTSYIDESSILKELDMDNKEWTIQQLREMDIVNAEEVVMSRLYKNYQGISTEIDNLVQSYKNYSDSLDSSKQDTEEYADAITKLKNDVNNVFKALQESSDVEIEMPELSTEFITEHLALVQQAAEGSIDALNQVRYEAAKDAIMKVYVDVDDSVVEESFNNIWSYIQSLDGTQLEVGAFLDDAQILAELDNMQKAGIDASKVINAALGSMGFSGHVEYEEGDVEIPNFSSTRMDGTLDIQAGAGKVMKFPFRIPKALVIDSVGGSTKSGDSQYKQAQYKPSPSSSGGGGGGGGSHTPTDHDDTAKKLDDAADAQKDAADAAKEAFEEEKKVAEELINISWFDWVERLLANVEKKVNKWTRTVDKMIHYASKNYATDKAIKANEAAITAQQRAYNTYMKQASKAAKKAGMTIESDDEAMTFEIVGGEALAKKYKKRVANGANLIEEFNGTKESVKLNKKIQAYIEWYEKAQACKDAIEELYDAEEQLIAQKLDNILDYFGTLEKYYDSFISKIDSVISKQEASGKRLAIEDIFSQYNANADAYNNLYEEFLRFRMGYDDKNRDAEEIEKDLEQLGMNLEDSDYYQKLKAREEQLAEKESAYNDKQEEIAQLKEKIADTTDKAEKKKLKKQLSELKAEAKKLKLTKTESKDYKAVKKQLKSLDENVENGIVNNVLASTGAYQKLITDIANLEKQEASKVGLTKDQKKKLLMLRDELNAINQGILVDQLSEYITVYQRWWKLNYKLQNKGKLTKEENLEYKQLEDRKNEMEELFDQRKKALEDELETALQISGETTQDLDRARKQQETELRKLYASKRSNVEGSYKTSSAYIKWYQEKISNDAAIKTQEQIMAQQNAIMEANKDKPNSKKYKDAKKKYDEANKKLTKLQKKKETYDAQEAAFNRGATDVNFSDYFKAYKEFTEAQEYFDKHGKFKNNDQRKSYDAAKLKLEQWNSQKQTQLDVIDNELKEKLEQMAKDFESKSNDLEQKMAENETKGWELIRSALELQMNLLEQDIANYEAMVSRYKTIADILASTDMETIKSYDLAEILDIDDSTKTISDLISENILGALQKAKDKLSLHSSQYDIYGELIEAAENKDFSFVLTSQFKEKLTDEGRARLEAMIEKANQNDWDGNTWVQEWETARAKVISDVASSITAIQELKDQLRESVVFKATQDAIESLETLNNRLSAMSNIINNDWVQDDNGLTKYGRAKIMLLANEAQNAQDIVRNAAKHIQEVQDAQLNDDTKYATEADYQKALSDAWNEYANSLQNVYSIDNEIYELSKKQQEAELKALNKIVDARKKALQAKKEYYDYDRNIKNQTKAIEALKAEVNALNGVSDAASKAKLKQLQANLQEAEDELQHTKDEHLYDMAIKALDQLVQDFSDSMEESAKTIKDTFEKWAEQIKQAVADSSGVDVNGALQEIADFLMGGYVSVPTAQTATVSSDIANNNLVPIDTDLGDESSLATPLSGILVDNAAIARITDSIEKSGIDITSINTRQDEYTKQMLTLIRSINDRLDVNLSSISDAINNKQLIANITINGQNANVTYNGMRTASGTAPSYH